MCTLSTPTGTLPDALSTLPPCLFQLHSVIDRIPFTVPEAEEDHLFARFASDLSESVPDSEDAWDIWDGLLNTVLQKNPQELQDLIT